jgi:hypothetical protein
MLLRPLLAAGCALLLAAAPAPRTLGPQGLGPVRVGMTLAAAQRVLGTKFKVDYIEDEKGCGIAVRRDGRDKGVLYMIDKGRVVRVDIDTPAIRTAQGVGVGSTAAQVRRAYPRLRTSPHAYTDGQYFEVKRPRGFGLVFEIEKGKVTTMRGGAYPAVGYVEGCA